MGAAALAVVASLSGTAMAQTLAPRPLAESAAVKTVASQRVQPAAATASAGKLTPQTIDGRPVLAVYHLVATAYGPSRRDNYPYGATNFFGQPLTPGTVAVDPSRIPLGSTLYVAGYHDPVLPSGGFVAHALDTGDAIKGARIDIYIDGSAATVSHFGVQPVTAYLLGPHGS